MLEQTTTTVGRARSLRTLALAIPTIAATLAVSTSDHPPYIGDDRMARVVPYFEPPEDVECIIRRLLGLPCETDLDEKPPVPAEPVQPAIEV